MLSNEKHVCDYSSSFVSFSHQVENKLTWYKCTHPHKDRKSQWCPGWQARSCCRKLEEVVENSTATPDPSRVFKHVYNDSWQRGKLYLNFFLKGREQERTICYRQAWEQACQDCRSAGARPVFYIISFFPLPSGTNKLWNFKNWVISFEFPAFSKVLSWSCWLA